MTDCLKTHAPIKFSCGELIVTYANDADACDEGQGWIGSLTGVEFVEFDP